MARTDLEQLVFQMSADMRQLTAVNKRALSDVKTSSTKMQREYDKLASEMGVGFGRMSATAGVAFGAIVGYATKAASDAAETANAFQVAFGSLTPAAQKFAESYSSSVGRALDETQAQMAKTQLVLTGIGIAADKALGLTQAIQRRSTDIGSLFNVSDAEAYQAILSGISGEAEPLKKFGVALNETAMKAELLRLGFKGNAEQAPEAAKAIARLNLIIAGTAKADGDAIRTKDGLANSVKATQAEFRNAAVQLGQQFLPIATEAAHAATALLTEFNKMPDSAKIAGLAFVGLVAAGGPIAALVEGLIKVVKLAGAARLGLMAIPGAAALAPAAAAVAAPVGAAAATLSLSGDTRKWSQQDILNARLQTEIKARKEIAKYEAKSGAKAAEKAQFWRGVLSGAQEEIRSLRAQERAENRSANRAAQRKKAAAGGSSGPALASFELPADLKTVIKGSGTGSGGKKAVIDLIDGVAVVDESTIFDLVNNLGGVRNAITMPDGNPNGFSSSDSAAGLAQGLEQSRAETQDFWANTIEGGLWAAFEEGGPGVAKFFARQLTAEAIHNLAAISAKALIGGGKDGALSKVGSLFAGFFASGGTIPAGQWGVVNDGGPEAVRARPGGGIDVMSNKSLQALSAPAALRVVVRDRIVRIETESSPYFDTRVQEVAAPVAARAGVAASEVGAAKAGSRAQSASRYRIARS